MFFDIIINIKSVVNFRHRIILVWLMYEYHIQGGYTTQGVFIIAIMI